MDAAVRGAQITGMDCVVIAGGRPNVGDPLFAYTGGRPKGLLPMAGKPMVRWVLDVLQASPYVEQIVVVGLGADVLPESVTAISDHGGLIANARAGIAWLQTRRPVQEAILVSTADIPLLTTEAIESFVESCRPYDHLVYYNVIPRREMEDRFPGSRRSYIRLNELEVAGGDLILVKPAILETDQATWEMLANARKHGWQLARVVGLGTLLRLLTRRLTLVQAEEAAGRLLGAPVRAVVSRHPELAMDVDKPHQLRMIRNELELRPS